MAAQTDAATGTFISQYLADAFTAQNFTGENSAAEKNLH